MYSTNSLIRDLENIGLKNEDIVIVHSSLKQIGKVVGGPASIILALEKVITNQGALVMPTFSEHLCSPDIYGENKEDAHEYIRENMPVYYKDLTPVDKMNGFLTEIFRKQVGVERSNHPHLSFAAWGKESKTIIENHHLDYALGKNSPLGKLYEHNAKVLLLGAPFESTTALHLSEYSIEKLYQPLKKWEAKIIHNGKQQWIEYMDVDNNSDFFPEIINKYIQSGGVYKKALIGDANSYLFPIVDLVNYGIKWMDLYR